MDLNYIERVLPLPLLEKVPACPIYCAGLMNFKNKCIPVIDLALGIGLTREELYTLNIPVLLCSDGSHPLGLIVDKIIGLGEIDEEKIEIHEEFTGNESPFFGAITFAAGVSLLINLNWIFALKLTKNINQSDKSHDEFIKRY